MSAALAEAGPVLGPHLPVVPSAMPDIGLVDSRRWSEQGVTHWHLTRTEIGIDDRDRFDAGRWAQIRHARGVEVAFEPDQAFEWLVMQQLKVLAEVRDPVAVAIRAGVASPEDWRSRVEVTWWMITHVPSAPAGGGLAVGGNRAVELYANPMTAAECTGHRR